MTVGLILPARWGFDLPYYLWSAGILAAAGVQLTVEGAERIAPRQAYFFVGNHQSAMDIPVLGVATGGHSRFMAKKSLFHIPILGWCMRLHGFVPIDRSSPRRAKHSIDAMLKRLHRRRVSMIVFPEGTRRTEDAVGDFKRGAMTVAQQSGMPLLPFAVHGSRDVHLARVFRIKPGPIRVAFGQVIPADGAKQLPSAVLCERVRDEVCLMYERLGTIKVIAPSLLLTTAEGERS